MSTLSAKPLTPSNINPSPSPSPSLMSGKPRRKPVNYDKNAASSEIESALSNSTTASSPSLAPVPSTVPATESPMFTHKNTSLSTLNTPIRTVPNQQRTATTDTSVNNRSSPVTSHSPLPPPPRTVSATPLRVVVPKYIADGERPISASLGSLDSGYKPPSSPRSDRDSYKSAPSLYSSPLTLSAEDSAKIALESDPQKREIASLRHLCENLQKEREELLTKYKRRAHFGTAKLADDPVITETLKKLTDDAEKRKMEQKDLHAAIEMLMRRIFALEKQVETLGAKPVTKTDRSLSESKYAEITEGVWRNYESLQTKVEMATGRTTTVMADIQAKMRDIRKHLKLAGPEEVTAASGLSESGIPSVAEAAESPSPPMAVVPDTTATKVPSDPVSLPKPAKVASPVQSSLLGSSSSAIPFFAPPNQPVELKSESTVLNKSALEPSESHEAEQSHKPEQKEPETFSKIAPEMTLMSSDKSDGTNSAKPVESSEISPAPQEKAKPSADPILGNTLDFETDLMAIMNNFGF